MLKTMQISNATLLKAQIKQARKMFQEAMQLPRPNWYNNYQSSYTFKYALPQRNAHLVVTQLQTANLQPLLDYCFQHKLMPTIYFKYIAVSYSPFIYHAVLFFQVNITRSPLVSIKLINTQIANKITKAKNNAH